MNVCVCVCLCLCITVLVTAACGFHVGEGGGGPSLWWEGEGNVCMYQGPRCIMHYVVGGSDQIATPLPPERPECLHVHEHWNVTLTPPSLSDQ